MSYLLDRKVKRKKFLSILLFVVAVLIVFYFRLGFWNGLSYISHKFLSPVLTLGNNLISKVEGVGSFFISKNTLYQENQNLQSQLDNDKATLANYDTVVAENTSLKDIWGRKDEKAVMVLSAILAKPNQSPYDTLVIDVGANKNIHAGENVFALGNVPIGRISDVYPDSSKVILFSNAGEKTQVVIGSKNIFMEVVGRGGGNFEMILPRDVTLSKGDQVVLPGSTPYVVGIVQTVISDPRDPFQKALLVNPVNVQELKFVEVEIQK